MKQDDRQVLKTLISLAVPTILQEILGTFLTYVDIAMVGRLGEKATAAVSTTTTVTWLVATLPYSFAVGFMALMSRAYGAQDDERMYRLSRLALQMSVAVGAVMTILCVGLSPVIPVWMRAAEDIREQASLYFAIICLPSVFRCASVMLGTCMQAIKDTRTPMIVDLSANILNVGLNYIFIYTLSMGVTGAAVASAISITLCGIAMSVVFFGKKQFAIKLTGTREMRKRDIQSTGRLMRETMKIAFPAFCTSAVSCAGYAVFAAMVSGMGTTVFAAHSIAVSAEEIFYLPGYGLRTATSALVGISIGERDWTKLRTVKRQSIAITLGMMLLNGTLLYFAAYPMMSVFTSSVTVAGIGAEMLKLVAFTEPFFGLMIVWEGICYGFGQTKRVLAIEAVSMWGVRILLTFFVVELWGLGLREVWYCMIADNVFKAVALTILNTVRPPEKSMACL